MSNYHIILKRSFIVVLLIAFSISGLIAGDVFLRIQADDYQKATLRLRNEMEIIAEEEGVMLTRCDASAADLLNDEGISFEQIQFYDQLSGEDLPPKPSGGIPLGVVVKPGNQGSTNLWSFHPAVALTENVIGYVETNVNGQLPGFTFKDLNSDSTWNHYIDTDLAGDIPLYIASGDKNIYYAFHYDSPEISNTNMRYYCYDTESDIETEIENFGYGYEGFGVSDTWVTRVGSKGNGWNNQIFAHNVETGARFEMLADSLPELGQYDYFGAPVTDGNTMVFTYTHASPWTTDLRVYSLGEDGEQGTADDTVSVLGIDGDYGSYDIYGRYIVWREGEVDKNIKGYDLGEDMLYGTADDGTVFTICDNASVQKHPRVHDGIVIWEDWRNAPSTDMEAPKDVYGYDIANGTEFRSTSNTDSLIVCDFNRGRVVMNFHDWDAPASDADIFMSNINGRIESDYYWIDVTMDVPPMAHSLLTGNASTSPFYFGNIVMATKGPLCALFISDGVGNDVALSYSAVTGEWNTDILTAEADNYTLMIDGDNGLVLGKTSSGYLAYTFNGSSSTFSATDSNIPKPTGFATGKNISFVWGDASTSHWVRTYDADLDSWSGRSGTTNDPWHVIATEFSDSLALLLHAGGDTICNHTQIEVYDLELHDWVYMQAGISRLNTINIHEWEKTIQMDANAHFAVATQEYINNYNDYIYTYGIGENEWKVLPTLSGFTFDKSFLGENFIVQGARSGDVWQGHIYNGCTNEWLPDYIESRQGIDNLLTYEDMMLAWYKNDPYNATLWAYSSHADGIQQLSIPYPGSQFTVKGAAKAGYVLAASNNYTKNNLFVFNGLKGEWKEPMEVYNTSQFMIEATGHTGIFLQQVSSMNGTAELKAYGYSVLKDEWDILDFKSNNVDGIFTSDFCGLLSYDHWYNTNTKYIHAYNSIEGKWSEDVINMYSAKSGGIRLDDRIMMVIEDGSNLDNYAKVHMFSPFLNKWSTTSFMNSYELEGYYTTPTSAFAWDGHEFQIIFSTETNWDSRPGRLDEIHVTDYAIAASMYYGSQTTTHYFYPPRTEIINEFEFTEGPNINVQSSWAVELTWKTNKYSDTRLVWGVDGYYEIIEKDTLEPTKDHRVLIEGLEAQKTYYYSAISIIEGVDTVHSDTLAFDTGVDNTAPALVGSPEAYRIHDNEASVWWTTNEPSTAIIRWGLTTTYTDTLSFSGSTDITNAVRMYELIKDTTYHYQVGGYDRYGNGPFFSGDYTFRTSNPLPVVTGLATSDSTLWGAAYMTWEPPRLDSTITKETFNHGIPVDWKIYNRGDNQKGTSWTSGYIGDNPVAYCDYGKEGERQEEWLVTNPITIDGTTGGVLNFWHIGYYNDYDNAPNKVMISWSGTDPEDFTSIWSSQNLPDDWSLAQINLNYSSNYGKTFYLAFVYESTNGETWAIDNIYMDWQIDGYYEDFTFDNDFWTQWTKAPMPSGFGIISLEGDECIGVDSYDIAPDTYQEEDSWMFSPSITISESHHLLGFWQMGWWSAMDNAPNEIRVAGSVSTVESMSTVVRSIYPVPEGWQWVTVDLSAYIGQTVKIAFRYHSYAGWLWNGLDWSDWYGETWYIDDMYLFENAPEMVINPDAKPNEKPLKFASSPNGKPIRKDDFIMVDSKDLGKELLASEVPQGSLDLPKEKPEVAIKLDKVLSEPAPSSLTPVLPRLEGYAVYGRFSGDSYFDYLGYVTTPEFIDWGTYLGYECEYYVEAVYNMGNSQPSEKVFIKGGESLKANEYAYDTGILYYSYWWYPGNAFANEFYFSDSVLQVEKIKVHVAKPGTFKMRLSSMASDKSLTGLFTSSAITATQENWYIVDVPLTLDASNSYLVEFLPQDTLVSISYDTYDCGASWLYNGSEWSISDKTLYIRLIGEKSPLTAIADIPTEFKLSQNYPNPFNPTTTIPFQIPEACDASVKIYDIRGALVKTLMSSHMESGFYNLVWDGSNANGNQVASGVYLIKIMAGEYSDTKKMVLVR